MTVRLRMTVKQYMDSVITNHVHQMIYSKTEGDEEEREAIAEEGSSMFTDLPQIKALITEWSKKSNGRSPIDDFIDWEALNKILDEFIQEML